MSDALEPTTDELLRFTQGEVTANRAAELEAWAAAAPANRARLDELRSMLTALAAPVPPVDLLAEVHAQFARAPPAGHRLRPGLVRAAAFAAAACLAAVWLTARPPTDTVRTKGTGATRADAWAGVQAYRVEPGGAPRPLGEHLRAHDSLLFAYTNGGPAPFPYLLIFAVDSSGRVYWYYPAWTVPGEDPQAISIQPSERVVELYEQVAQPLSPGPVVVHAIFSRRALRVSEVERALREVAAVDAGPLPFPDTAQQELMVGVAP